VDAGGEVGRITRLAVMLLQTWRTVRSPTLHSRTASDLKSGVNSRLGLRLISRLSMNHSRAHSRASWGVHESGGGSQCVVSSTASRLLTSADNGLHPHQMSRAALPILMADGSVMLKESQHAVCLSGQWCRTRGKVRHPYQARDRQAT
jgi:hypothetical protein